jgi:hypothetical protein
MEDRKTDGARRNAPSLSAKVCVFSGILLVFVEVLGNGGIIWLYVQSREIITLPRSGPALTLISNILLYITKPPSYTGTEVAL